MEKLEEIKLKKILLEFELLELEEKYIEEFVSRHQAQFNQEILRYIPNLQINQNPFIEKELEFEDFFEKEEIIPEDNKKIKKIYKDISKVCHPDKTNDEDLNEFYVESKLAYEKGDLLSLYKLGRKVNIQFDIELKDIPELEKVLLDRRCNLLKLESTFLYLWVNARNEKEKEKWIVTFLKQKNFL